jgi:endonuclease/exonuclease/phosphatase family metal-dependent hydrolase
MKLVTYNVHKCRGMDGRTHVGRIAEVLGRIDADIVALQEVFASDHGRHSQVEILASELGLETAFGRTRHLNGRPYGNAILSRWPILSWQHIDLPWTRREQRGCVRADIETPLGTIHAFNIHMGTSYFERRHQIRSFVNQEQVLNGLSGPRVLVGDFNEWVSGLTTRVLAEKFESLNMQLHIRRKRSYPGLLPFLHLDHIYFERPLHIETAELVRNRKSMVASDHLPLVARFGIYDDNPPEQSPVPARRRTLS